MTPYIDTYYRRTLGHGPALPALDRNLEVEICVIGGGLAGLTTAYELARRGRKVALLEQRRIAWGASGRNGGFVSAGYATGLGRIRQRCGEADAATLYRMSAEGVEMVRGHIAQLDIEDADVKAGLLRVIRYDGADGLKAQQAEMNGKFGEKLEFRSRDEIRATLISKSYHQGLYDPAAFHFHPLNYARALAAASEKLGAEIFEETAAAAVAAKAGGHVVTTAQGRVTAQHVVFAGGGYTDRLMPQLHRAFLPISTYVLLTEPLGDLLPRTIRTESAIGDDRRAGDYYRIVGDGRLLWGGRITTRTRDPHDLAAYLRREMIGTYPQLKDLGIETAWSGLMSYARHLMPQIGRLGDGLWYCTAFGGHGMNTTAIGGRVIAEGITGETDRYRLFQPFGLDWNGGPFGKVAAQLTYWTYQAMDFLQEARSRT